MVCSKKKKSTETVPAKDLIVDIFDKDFKIAALKILKELREDGQKLVKMWGHHGNINEEIDIIETRRNYGAEQYNNKINNKI